MMMHDAKLPYLLQGANQTAILLFLHGRGEGYRNNGRESHDNLKNQGPPKHFEAISSETPAHPLATSLLLIAPQLPDRDAPWNSVLGEVKNIIEKYREHGAHLYVMGFSKGGRAVFDFARPLNASAAVTIDAPPMGRDARTAAVHAKSSIGNVPFWSIYASYSDNHGIRLFHEHLNVPNHDDISLLPASSRQWRSQVCYPNLKEVTRHSAIADEVTKGEAAYRWLLQH
ncbi:hypothetical protein PQR57_41900 [Paraburkholderia dipogonis]|uniref:Alpha/beta hydrolase n=1 Tax=Paraburkholderia dipogonis TaxID=1211383 RepID=A0ABW9B5K8_9BURK